MVDEGNRPSQAFGQRRPFRIRLGILGLRVPVYHSPIHVTHGACCKTFVHDNFEIVRRSVMSVAFCVWMNEKEGSGRIEEVEPEEDRQRREFGYIGGQSLAKHVR